MQNDLADFISADNFGRRLKTLKGLTPYEFICKCWTSEPERIILNPIHQMPGSNSLETVAVHRTVQHPGCHQPVAAKARDEEPAPAKAGVWVCQ